MSLAEKCQKGLITDVKKQTYSTYHVKEIFFFSYHLQLRGEMESRRRFDFDSFSFF